MRKVTGFNTRLISALGPYLTLDSNCVPTQTNSKQNGHLHGKNLKQLRMLDFLMFVKFSAHRRTASLPSGPLLTANNSVEPTVSLQSNPSSLFPSVTEFKCALDELESPVAGDNNAQPDGNVYNLSCVHF